MIKKSCLLFTFLFLYSSCLHAGFWNFFKTTFGFGSSKKTTVIISMNKPFKEEKKLIGTYSIKENYFDKEFHQKNLGKIVSITKKENDLSQRLKEFDLFKNNKNESFLLLTSMFVDEDGKEQTLNESEIQNVLSNKNNEIKVEIHNEQCLDQEKVTNYVTNFVQQNRKKITSTSSNQFIIQPATSLANTEKTISKIQKPLLNKKLTKHFDKPKNPWKQIKKPKIYTIKKKAPRKKQPFFDTKRKKKKTKGITLVICVNGFNQRLMQNI